MAVDFNKIPFKQARWFTPTDGRTRRKIVLHTMEAPEKGSTAENVASYFARTTVKASAHYCIDRDSVVQCVQTKDVAYAAPGANRDGIQLELAGYAKQSRQDWQDEFSQDMLRIAAVLCGTVLLAKLPIPIKALSAEDMQRDKNASGFTTHAAVSSAFGKSSHWDPGPNFPMEQFLSMVRDAKEGRLTV